MTEGRPQYADRVGAALEVANVAHSYGSQPALADVSFDVGRGELFGLLGPNGGGKTTLFRVVTTLLRPDGGSVRVFGDDVTASPAAVRRSLGVVFQQTALDAELTVAENLRCQAALVGLSKGSRENRIDELLTTFGLADRARDRVRTLSGGLARRADLARGLLHQPRLLLLDEPTTGLDPTARRELWASLARLQRTSDTTVVVATHLMEEAERCDRVGILDRGKLVALGAPATLKDELGAEALWLESPQPVVLIEQLESHFGLSVRRVGELLLIEAGDDAPSVLGKVMGAFPDLIEAATIRRPSLDDVFAERTGARISAEREVEVLTR